MTLIQIQEAGYGKEPHWLLMLEHESLLTPVRDERLSRLKLYWKIRFPSKDRSADPLQRRTAETKGDVGLV